MTDVLATVLAELAALPAVLPAAVQPMTEQAGWLTADRRGGEPAPSS